MRPLRLAMMGGGAGAGIAGVHRAAARLDGDWQLVAGMFSRDPERNAAAADTFGLERERCYPDIASLVAGELARDGVDCVAIVAPNYVHAPAAIACLDGGFHVLCEKPMALDSTEAAAVKAAAERSRATYHLVQNYSAMATPCISAPYLARRRF